MSLEFTFAIFPLVPVRILMKPDAFASVFPSFIFLLLFSVLWLRWEFQWVLCTVYRTHKSLFLAKFSSKMSPTTLFTHLKIILL